MSHREMLTVNKTVRFHMLKSVSSRNDCPLFYLFAGENSIIQLTSYVSFSLCGLD